MKKIKTLALAAGIAATMAPAAHAETVLRYAAFWPTNDWVHTYGIRVWAKEIEKATNGSVKIRFLPKSPGGPRAYVDLVRDGVMDVAPFLPGAIPGRFLTYKVVEFPFSTGTNAETTSVAYWRVYQKHLAKANEHKGVKLLTVWTHGPGVLHNSKRPVEKIADIKGLKLRVPSEAIGSVAREVGAVPLLVPISQVHDILSKGTADGLFTPFNAVLDFKLGKILRYSTTVKGGVYNLAFHFIMNQKKWASLTKSEQAAIEKFSGEAGARLMGAAWDRGDKAGIKYVTESGMKISKMNPAFRDALGAAAQPLIDKWIAEVKAKGIDGRAALDMLAADRGPQ